MSVNLEKLKVLIVEDIDPIKCLVTAIIETLGAKQIYTAEDGEEGFNTFCNVNPDIVLTDWHMPRNSGIDLVKNIRRSDYSPNRMAPIIMITGYNAPARISKCRDEGVTEFIAKPFSAEDLIKRIAHVIKYPRDFIDCIGYFGPDRRRSNNDNYKGKLRRESDFDKQGIT